MNLPSYLGKRKHIKPKHGCTNSIQPSHTHTHQHWFLPSFSAVYRETSVITGFYGCSSDISTSIPLLSSFLATQASFILFYWSCLGHSEGLRLGVKLYQRNDQPFLTSYISQGIKGNPHCVNGADTHSQLHTCVCWQSGPNRSKSSGGQYAVPLGSWY